jgi:hypothetical protein
MSEPKHCQDFGVAGDHVELINPLPKGKVCALIGFAQTAAEIKVEVIDGDNKVVAEISKEGGSTDPTLLRNHGEHNYWFEVKHNKHFIRVTSSEKEIPRVLVQQISVMHGETPYAAGYMIAAEDHPQEGGDCDFNDCVAYLTWTEREK